MADVRTRVMKLVAQKRPIAQVIAAKPLAVYDATWGQGFMKTDQFLTIVYTSLAKGPAPKAGGTHHR